MGTVTSSLQATEAAIVQASAPRRNLLRLLKGGFGLAVLLFWGILIQRQWNQLSAREWSLDFGLAVIALLAFCLYFLGLGAGWALLVKAMGYSPPLGGALGAWLLSMPTRYVPGNLWHIATRVRLAGSQQVPAEGVLASSAVEQVLTVLSAACLGLAWLPSWMGTGWTGWTLAPLLAGMLALQPPVLHFLLHLGSRLLGRPMPSFTLGYRRMASLFLWYGLVNAVNGIAFLLLAAAAAPSPQALWPSLASAYCLAYVIGYLGLLTPSGIGVREAALASMLSLHMPISLAITLSLLARLFSTAGEAAAVLLVGLPLIGWPRPRP